MDEAGSQPQIMPTSISMVLLHLFGGRTTKGLATEISTHSPAPSAAMSISSLTANWRQPLDMKPLREKKAKREEARTKKES